MLEGVFVGVTFKRIIPRVPQMGHKLMHSQFLIFFRGWKNIGKSVACCLRRFIDGGFPSWAPISSCKSCSKQGQKNRSIFGFWLFFRSSIAFAIKDNAPCRPVLAGEPAFHRVGYTSAQKPFRDWVLPANAPGKTSRQKRPHHYPLPVRHSLC